MSTEQNESERHYHIMANAPEKDGVEFFEGAKYPESIAMTAAVPILAKNIIVKSRADFEKESHIQFCNFQIPYFCKTIYYQNFQEDLNHRAALFTASYNHLIVSEVNKEVGKGLFAKSSLSQGVHIPYGGKYVDSNTRDTGYKVSFSDKTQAIDAVKFRNYGAYAQHAPAQIPNEIEFLIPGLKEIIATANAEFTLIKFGNIGVPLLKLIRPVTDNEGIFWDYGDDYWHYRAKPSLFDRYGRVIPRGLYCNDKISFISPSTTIVSFNRNKLLDYLRNEPTGFFNYFETDQATGEMTPRFESCQVLRKQFEEKGYIPAGNYFKQLQAKTVNAKPIDWQRELRQTAHDGRIEDMEYILDWLAPKPPIDLDASGASGKTSLHFAAEQGEVYVVYFLILRGADITKKDAHQKTALDLVQEQLAQQPQDRKHQWQEDYEKIAQYLTEKLIKNNNNDVDTSVTGLSTSYIKL